MGAKQYFAILRDDDYNAGSACETPLHAATKHADWALISHFHCHSYHGYSPIDPTLVWWLHTGWWYGYSYSCLSWQAPAIFTNISSFSSSSSSPAWFTPDLQHTPSLLLLSLLVPPGSDSKSDNNHRMTVVCTTPQQLRESPRTGVWIQVDCTVDTIPTIRTIITPIPHSKSLSQRESVRRTVQHSDNQTSSVSTLFWGGFHICT